MSVVVKKKEKKGSSPPLTFLFNRAAKAMDNPLVYRLFPHVAKRKNNWEAPEDYFLKIQSKIDSTTEITMQEVRGR